MEDKSERCSTCGKFFEATVTHMSCAVMHSKGQCCHYGQKEIVMEDKRLERGVGEQWNEPCRECAVAVDVTKQSIIWTRSSKRVIYCNHLCFAKSLFKQGYTVNGF